MNFKAMYELKYEHTAPVMKSDWFLYLILESTVETFRMYVDSNVKEGEALDELVLVFNSGTF
jgi:hypothetical protein